MRLKPEICLPIIRWLKPTTIEEKGIEEQDNHHGKKSFEQEIDEFMKKYG